MDITIMNLNLARRDAIGAHVLNLAAVLSKNHDVSLMIQDPSSIGGSAGKQYPLRTINSAGPGGARSLFSRLLRRPGRQGTLAVKAYSRHQLGDVLWANYPRFYDYLDVFKNRDRTVAGVFDYHGVTPRHAWDDPKIAPILEEGAAKIGYGKYADVAIAHSDFTRDELERACGCTAIKMGYAIDAGRFAGADGDGIRKQYGLSGSKVLLYVGRMAGNKRVDLIIRSLATVRKTIPDVRFLCVGHVDFPHHSEYLRLKQLVADMGLEENVIFAGSVPDDALPGYFCAADLYVTSSLHEGFCIPAVEAMACGRPVIGSACTALPETIGDGGLTFPPEDHAELARQIVRVLDDRELYRKLAAAGKARAEQFSYRNFERSVNEIIEMCGRAGHH